MCMPWPMCGGQRQTWVPAITATLFETKSCVACCCALRASWPMSFWELSCLCLPCQFRALGLQLCHHASIVWGSNTRPHVCPVSNFPLSRLPQPCYRFSSWPPVRTSIDQFYYMWNQLRPKLLSTPVRDFLDWVI